MTYTVKEIYFTLQGEGAQTGRPAVFCRFTGCNLWTGREEDRAKAVCQFCDTDFVGTDGPGGGQFKTAADLVAAIAAQWPTNNTSDKFVVCTGGEPLLQLDPPAIEALHGAGFSIAVESNGTVKAPEGIDWLCISPKADAQVVQRSGDELKLVYPQEKARPEAFANLDFKRFSLQPLDDENRAAHTQAAVAYCLEHPQWQLSLQTHKLLGLP